MPETANIKLFTEILDQCNYNDQNEETKRRLQSTLSYLLRQAQDRCVEHMLSARTQVHEKILTRNALKEEARNLMQQEMQKLITSKDFLDSCQLIVSQGQESDTKSTKKNTTNQSFPKISPEQKKIDKNHATKESKSKLKNAKQIYQHLESSKFYDKPITTQTFSKSTLNSEKSYQILPNSSSRKSSRTVALSAKQKSNQINSKTNQRPQTASSITSNRPILSQAGILNKSTRRRPSLKKLTGNKEPTKSISSIDRFSSTTPAFSEKIKATMSLLSDEYQMEMRNTDTTPPPQSPKDVTLKRKVAHTRKEKRNKTTVKKVNVNSQNSTTDSNSQKSKSQLSLKSSKHIENSRSSSTSLRSHCSMQNCKVVVYNSPSVSSKSCIPANLFSTLRNPQIQRFQRIQEFVEMAIRNHKTFMILGYSLVRRFLYNRGWVERLITTKLSIDVQQQADKMQIYQLINLLDDKTYGYVYSRMLKSKLLGNNTCDLIWDPRPLSYSMIKHIKKPVYLNHFRKRGEYDFCSKIGLCRNMRNLQWNYRTEMADVRFPRTYLLNDHEMDDFIYDFRITACLGLIKWFVDRAHTTQTLISHEGRIPIDAFYFAILQCIGYIKHCKDIEYQLTYTLATWNKFIDHYYQLLYVGDHFKSGQEDNIPDMIQQGTEILQRVRQYRPDLDSEGIYNIWILKPDQHSRGHGIHVCRKMCQIKEIVAQNTHLKYLVQKYIEKPLIIYNTKFDIRQWFLVSTTMPLTVWMYTECYLRFSSQQYDLRRFHESIHLTNNSVQCRYKNANRDSNLPPDNMWDSNKFNAYLSSIGHSEVWPKIIYPKMKQAVMAVLLSAKDDMEMRQFSFELYGADFMLTADFQPWLIEINSHPALSPSTSVTARLCPQVIEDVIRGIQIAKLIIDKAKVPGSSSGKFELIYTDQIPTLPEVSNEGFFVNGTPLSLQYYKLIDESMAKTKILEVDHEISYTNLRNRIQSFTTDSDPPIKDPTQAALSEKSLNVENTIETTRKIVHMKSILKSLLDLLSAEQKKRNVSIGEQRKYLNIEDVTSAVTDIQSTIATLSNGDNLCGNRSTNGILATKTCLSPKTLINLFSILTMVLYGKTSDLL